jgi:integrase
MKAMAGKTSKLGPYLQRRGKLLYAVVTVKPSMRKYFNGNTKLLKSLETHSVSEAREANYLTVVQQLRGKISSMEKTAKASNGSAIDGEMLLEYKSFDQRIAHALDAGDVEGALVVEHALIKRAQDISDSHGDFAGGTMLMAGTSSPLISQFIETWLQEKRFSDRTKSDHRLALKRLVAWMESRGIYSHVKNLTNKLASDFKVSELIDKKVNPKTANKLLSGLRTYWKWLKDHHYADENPWILKSLPKQNLLPDERERAFSDDEVRMLFAGGADAFMRDVMAVAALTGMREEEIFQLTVADCGGGVFNIRKSKTIAGRRKVPVHSQLKKLVARRCKGKASTEYLFEGASPTGWGGARSMAFSKRFATYRRRCGVDEKLEGRRRSRVNFHSWRRWAITKADQAGHRREDIERVVGHKPQGMSIGGDGYSDGMTMDQRSAVVESIRLPKGVQVRIGRIDQLK